MNLALLSQNDFISETEAVLSGRRLDHVREVIRAQQGDSLTVGLRNGPIGRGQICEVGPSELRLSIEWTSTSPPPLPVTLIVALPRPKMLKRIVQTAATMGVKQLYFINAYKVEKSFWQSPWLNPNKMEENLILGLEQAKDTIMPQVYLRKLFKPFVEDELPALAANTRALVAHPGGGRDCPHRLNQPSTLAIGPEGGFTPYEVGKMIECGFEQIQLGSRILRVETAVPVLLGKLFD